MDVMWVVLGVGCLGVGIVWLAGVQADRRRPPEQRRNFKTRSLRGPTLAGLFWLLLGTYWLARGLLA